jgi:hypothetical protein
MSQTQQPTFPVHPVVGEWLNDPEFQALPDDVKSRKIGNFFDKELAADAEFSALPSEVQEKKRSNFMAVHTTPELSFSRIGSAAAHEITQYPGRVATSLRSNLEYVPEADDSNVQNLIHDPVSGPEVQRRASELAQDRWMPRDKALRIAANEIEQTRHVEKAPMVDGLKSVERAVTPDVNPAYDGRSSGIVEDAVRGLAGSAPDMAITAVNPAAGIVSMFANMQGGKQKELEGAGVDSNRAFKASAGSAMASLPMEALGNMLQLRAVGGLAKSAFTRNLTHLAESALGEGFTEYAQQYPDEFANLWAANPQLSPAELQAEALKRLPEMHGRAVQAGKVGALAGSMLPGAGITVKAPFDAYRAARKSRIKEGQSVDLLKNDIDLTDLEDNAPAEHGQDAGYSEEEVNARYESSRHEAVARSEQARNERLAKESPFPDADMLSGPSPEVAPAHAQTPVQETSYRDVPGYSEQEVEARYRQQHQAEFPTAGEALSGPRVEMADPWEGLKKRSDGKPYSQKGADLLIKSKAKEGKAWEAFEVAPGAYGVREVVAPNASGDSATAAASVGSGTEGTTATKRQPSFAVSDFIDGKENTISLNKTFGFDLSLAIQKAAADVTSARELASEEVWPTDEELRASADEIRRQREERRARAFAEAEAENRKLEEEAKKPKEKVQDASTSEFEVNTEESGEGRVRVIRRENGATALIVESKAKESQVIDVNPEFAASKSDSELVEYCLEPLGVLEISPTKPTINEAAHEAATSPENELPQPTEGQKQAGNYRKGHIKIGGLDISIENPAGSERSGTDADGKPWSVTMADHYGYIRGTEGKDGDHVDVFLNPAMEAEEVSGSPVFIVDQVDPKTGKFDEHKVVMGYPDAESAEAGYKANYAEGWKGVGAVTPMTFEGFKGWLKNGKTKRPVGKIAKRVSQAGRDAESVKRSVLEGNPQANAETLEKLVELPSDEWFESQAGKDPKVILQEIIRQHGTESRSIARGRADYLERRQARIDRLEARAEKAHAKASAHHQAADMSESASGIPFGQPILVGHHSESRHRNKIERARKHMDMFVEEHNRAEDLERQAHAADVSQAISSDDPEAITKLKDKIVKLEAYQERMKAANKVIKNKKLSDDEKISKLVELGIEESVAKHLLKPDFVGRIGYPSFELSNNNANIRRIKERLERMQRNDARSGGEFEFNGGRIVDNPENNRVQIHFDAIPSDTIRTELKRNGFKWSRAERVWQRLRTPYALHVAKQITGNLNTPVNHEDYLYSLSTEHLNEIARRAGVKPRDNKVATVEAITEGNGRAEIEKIIKDVNEDPEYRVALSRGIKSTGMSAESLREAVAPLQSASVNSLPVRVVQSMTDLPAHIQAEARKGNGVINAAYDGTAIYLVADRIASPEGAVALWMHENGLHHGLRSMMPHSDYKRLLNQVWLSAGGKKAFKDIAARYGLDLSTKEGQQSAAEEYLAKIAEKIQADEALSSREKSLWRKLREGIMALLRKTGFDVKLTDYEIAGIVQDAVRWTIHGERSESGVHVFSGGEVAASSRDVTPEEAGIQLQHDMEEWSKQLDDFEQGKLGRKMLVVGSTPDVLRKLGVPNLPMAMTGADAAKVIGPREDHQLPLAQFKKLPRALWEPIMIFDSSEKAGALTILTEIKNPVYGKNVMVAVHYDYKEQRVRINRIASAHVRKDGWYSGQILAGRLRYQDKKKSLAWARTNRLQLPKVPTMRGKKNILTENDIVKPVQPQNNVALSLAPSEVVRSVAGDDVRVLFNSGDLSKLREIISLPHWIAKAHSGFKAAYDVQLRRMDQRAKRLAAAVEQAQDLWEAPQHVLDEVAAIVWKLEGKKIKALDGIPKFEKVRGEDGRPDYKAGRPKLEINPEYTKAFNAWLAKQGVSPEARKVYGTVRKVLDDALLRAYDHMRNMSEVSDDAIAQFRSTINHVHNYFPHQRYGDYFVTAYATVDGKRQVVWRQHYDALTEKAGLATVKGRKLIQQLKKDHVELANIPMSDWVIGPVQKLPEDVYSTKVDTMAMEQIVHRATESIANGEQAKEIKTALTKAIADTLKARGWGSHMIGRKGIPGFEKQDIRRVLYDYLSGESGWETKMEAARGFAKAVGSINAKERPAEYRYTLAYVEDMLRNADKADRIVGNIKGVAFLWYLGFNLKTAALNLTQNVISGAPRLGMDMPHSHGAYTAFANACKDVVAGAKNPEALPADEQRLLKEMYQEGTIASNYLDEIQGRIGLRNGLGGWEKTLSYAGLPMAVAERFNRATLALAAYRTMRDGKATDNAKSRHAVEGDMKPEEKAYLQAKGFAEEVTKDAHFVYGKANHPQFIRHTTVGRSVLNPMYTFRTFSHNLLSFWRWALGQGGPGAKAVLQSIGGTVALGGLKSVPFFATLSALWQWGTGDDDDPKEEIRKALPDNDMVRDMVIYGAPALAGVDMGGSLSVETPILSELEPGASADDVMSKNVSDLFGIPWDLAVRKPSRVVKAAKGGDYLRAVEEAAPTALKNILGAYRMSTDGHLSLSGKPISEPGEFSPRKFSAGEAAAKALGFQPVESSKAWDKTNARQLSAKARADALAGMAGRFATAMRHGGDASDSIQDLMEWNAKQMEKGKPWMVILPDEFEAAVKGRMMGGKVGRREAARFMDQQQAYE